MFRSAPTDRSRSTAYCVVCMPTCIATSSGKIEQLGGTVARDGPKGLITINGEFTGSIVIAGSLSPRGGSAMRWNPKYAVHTTQPARKFSGGP
jgi:hypothetical protein